MNLQDKLYYDLKNGAEVGVDFSLEDGLLIYSGADNEKILTEYKLKLNKIHTDFMKYFEKEKKEYVLYSDETLIKADLLNKFIGFGKLNRYFKEQYKLKQAIDNGLSTNIQKKIANCSGLSKLYAVLGLKENLHLSCIDVIYDNSLNDHILLNLKYNKKEYLIETTEFEGFDSKNKYKDKKELPIEDLFFINLSEFTNDLPIEKQEKYFELLEKRKYSDMASLYHNWSINFFIKGDYNKAEEFSNKAKTLKPNSCVIRLNLSESQIKKGKIQEAKNNIYYVLKNGDPSIKKYAEKLLIPILEMEKNLGKVKYSPNVSNPEDFCEFGI